MSIFDPLYEIESTEGSNGSPATAPSMQQITNALKEFDGSGSGLMTAKQLLAACQTIDNLGFSKQELIEYIKEGQEVAGDGSGKIKMGEFASYLAFEAKKKFKKSSGKSPPLGATSNTAANGLNGAATVQQDNSYINPFADFFDDSTQPQPAPVAPQKTNSSTKITITNPMQQTQVGHHPMGSSNLSAASNVSMKGSYSPTQSDPTELPNWFGHSLNTIHNHPDQPSMVDNPFGDLFDDDNKTSGTGDAQKQLKLMNVSTNDILFEDSDAASSPKSGVSQKPNLSPAKAKNMKRSRHQQTKSVGLIAPPRAKGDRRPNAKKKKKRNSGKGMHQAALSASFNNVFAITPDELGLDGLKNADMTQSMQFGVKEPEGTEGGVASNSLRLTNSQSAHTPETKKKVPLPATKAPGRPQQKGKRPKIDAIVEMKRGAAMLKYGRRGFPHFRRFQVSHDLSKLLWYSRKKGLGETHVCVRDMKDILSGQQTEVFKQCTQKTLEKASFSIIYGSKMKSLDVVAKSAEEAELWIKGLKGLIKANAQGKLHKVVQILVDVDFKDISKTKYRTATDEERRKHEQQHKQRPELVHTIEQTLQQSRKIFVSLNKMSKLNNVQNSNEYENIQTLTSEIEERLEEIEYGMQNKTADLQDVKRDVWVLKVDVTVLEEKVKVLSKIKTAIPI